MLIDSFHQIDVCCAPSSEVGSLYFPVSIKRSIKQIKMMIWEGGVEEF